MPDSDKHTTFSNTDIMRRARLIQREQLAGYERTIADARQKIERGDPLLVPYELVRLEWATKAAADLRMQLEGTR